VLLALAKLAMSGELFIHLGTSLGRSSVGCLLALTVGIPVGILLGWFARFEELADPVFQVCRNTSVLAMFPIFILVFGLGEASKIAIIFWGSIWPTFLNTISGVKGIDPQLIRAARSMGVARLWLFWKVVLPAILPSLLTGVRLSAGIAIIILVAAEMVGAQSGLGFLIFYSEQKYEIPNMYAGIVTISLLGVLVNYMLIRCEQHFTRWKERAGE
jgi:NitT/TauT family transport system permease protein